MNEAQALDRATKAKAILESPIYLEAFHATRQSLFDLIEKAPIADVATAEDARRCLKLLTKIDAHMRHMLETGKVAQFNLAEREKRSLNPLRGIFR